LKKFDKTEPKARKGKPIGFKPTAKMREYLFALAEETGMPVSQHVRDAVFAMMQSKGAATR
jgi:hypothetical protein